MPRKRARGKQEMGQEKSEKDFAEATSIDKEHGDQQDQIDNMEEVAIVTTEAEVEAAVVSPCDSKFSQESSFLVGDEAVSNEVQQIAESPSTRKDSQGKEKVQTPEKAGNRKGGASAAVGNEEAAAHGDLEGAAAVAATNSTVSLPGGEVSTAEAMVSNLTGKEQLTKDDEVAAVEGVSESFTSEASKVSKASVPGNEDEAALHLSSAEIRAADEDFDEFKGAKRPRLDLGGLQEIATSEAAAVISKSDGFVSIPLQKPEDKGFINTLPGDYLAGQAAVSELMTEAVHAQAGEASASEQPSHDGLEVNIGSAIGNPPQIVDMKSEEVAPLSMDLEGNQEEEPNLSGGLKESSGYHDIDGMQGRTDESEFFTPEFTASAASNDELKKTGILEASHTQTSEKTAKSDETVGVSAGESSFAAKDSAVSGKKAAEEQVGARSQPKSTDSMQEKSTLDAKIDYPFLEDEADEPAKPDLRPKVSKFVCLSEMDSTINSVCLTDIGNCIDEPVAAVLTSDEQHLPIKSGSSAAGSPSVAERRVDEGGKSSSLSHTLGAPAGAAAGYNVGSQIVTSIGSGGFQYLLAGMRSNCGISAGRYAFEVRVLDFQPNIPCQRERVREGEAAIAGAVVPRGLAVAPSGVDGGHSTTQFVRGHIRIGVCTLNDTLFLGDSASSWGYDSDGSIHRDSQCYKPISSKRIEKYDVITIVVRMQESLESSSVEDASSAGGKGSKNLPADGVSSTDNKEPKAPSRVDASIDEAKAAKGATNEVKAEFPADAALSNAGSKEDGEKADFDASESAIVVKTEKKESAPSSVLEASNIAKVTAHSDELQDTSELGEKLPEKKVDCILSVFRNGQRMCAPQRIPWKYLKGHSVFPCVAFRGATLIVNFGAVGIQRPLPFSVRFLQDAAEEDVEWSGLVRPTDRKYEVIFPVGIPNEGTFDWIDYFMEQNPSKYVELSDRMLVNWAVKSGLQKLAPFRRRGREYDDCLDKPLFNFGNYLLDEPGNFRKTAKLLALARQRHYISMELKKNLISADRRESLQDFEPSWFKKIAYVVMGEPPEEYKERQHSLQAKSIADGLIARPSSVSSAVKDAKAVEPLWMSSKPFNSSVWFRKKEQEDLSVKTIANCFTEFSLPTISEGFDEIRYAWAQKEESQVYLNDWIRKNKITVVMYDHKPSDHLQKKLQVWYKVQEKWQYVLQSFQKEENVSSAANKKFEVCMEKLKALYVQLHAPTRAAEESVKEKEEKSGNRAENEVSEAKDEEGATPETTSSEGAALAGEEAVTTEESAVVEAKSEKQEQESVKSIDVSNLSPPTGEAAEALEKEILKIVDALMEDCEEVEKADVSKQGGEALAAASGEDEEDAGDESIFIPMKCNEDGSKVPIFLDFKPEDWTLLQARIDIYLLIEAFKNDVVDEDRRSIYVEHFPFYFRLYFSRQFRYADYPYCTNMSDLLELLKDTVYQSSPPSVLQSSLPEDCPWATFCKLTERSRLTRSLRLLVKLDTLKAVQAPEPVAPFHRERETKPIDKISGAPFRPPREALVRPLAKDPLMGRGAAVAEGLGASRRGGPVPYGLGGIPSGRPIPKAEYRDSSGGWKGQGPMYGRGRDYSSEGYRNRGPRDMHDTRMDGWEHRGHVKGGATGYDGYRRSREDYKMAGGKMPSSMPIGGHAVPGADSKRNGFNRNLGSDRGGKQGFSDRPSRVDDSGEHIDSRASFSGYDSPVVPSKRHQYDNFGFSSSPSSGMPTGSGGSGSEGGAGNKKRSRTDDYVMVPPSSSSAQALNLHFGGNRGGYSHGGSSQNPSHISHASPTSSKYGKSPSGGSDHHPYSSGGGQRAGKSYPLDPYAQGSSSIQTSGHRQASSTSPGGSQHHQNLSTSNVMVAGGVMGGPPSYGSRNGGAGGGGVMGGRNSSSSSYQQQQRGQYHHSQQQLQQQEYLDASYYSNYSFGGGIGVSSLGGAGGTSSGYDDGGVYSSSVGGQQMVGMNQPMMGQQGGGYQSAGQYQSVAAQRAPQYQNYCVSGGNLGGANAGGVGGYYSSSYGMGTKGSK